MAFTDMEAIRLDEVDAAKSDADGSRMFLAERRRKGEARATLASAAARLRSQVRGVARRRAAGASGIGGGQRDLAPDPFNSRERLLNALLGRNGPRGGRGSKPAVAGPVDPYQGATGRLWGGPAISLPTIKTCAVGWAKVKRAYHASFGRRRLPGGPGRSVYLILPFSKSGERG